MKIFFTYLILFIFAAATIAQVEKIHFQHLSVEDGLSQNTVTSVFQNKHLPDGEYTFKVKGTNSFKQWNEQGTSIKLSIVPPFWETSWFNFLALIAFISLFYGFFRYRVKIIRLRNIKLEKRVKERTSNLTEANNKLRDEISRRKKIEKELLVAKETSEIANKSKSEFLSNMSHEIRTPMNGVIGLTDLVLKTKLSAEQRNFLTMVKYSADQLLNILNDILDFSKIEAGQLDLEHINFDLRSTIENAGDILVYVLEQKNITLNVYMENDVPQYLIGDPGRLRQILVNLISNAFKFTDEGSITIIVKLESRTKDMADIHFSVSDTGIGIEKERHDTIFKSFTQADSSTSRKYGGTGLGLSISKQLVEMMQGRIWLESPAKLYLPEMNEPQETIKGGPGTTFHFTARLKVQDIRPEEITLLPKEIQGLNVLAIDENPTSRFILSQMVENFKCNISTVPNPSEATELLEKNDFQLIIIDYQNEEISVDEFIKEIRRKHKTPIIQLESVNKNNGNNQSEEPHNVWKIDRPLKQLRLIKTIISAMDATAKDLQKNTPMGSLPDSDIQNLTNMGTKVSILLVEDNKINQKVALAILKKTDIPIDIAEDGKMAISALKEKQYDLILMDVQMPNMDGIEATKIIRKDMRLTDLPIIAMTAQTMKGDSDKCINAGMNDYISKPVSAKKLYKTLNKWLKNKTVLSETT